MAWYNTNYLYKKPITIDHTKVSGGSDLSSFPVLISLTDTTLKTVTNGGNVQNSSGYDIIFTDSTEATKLDHEIESYTATTGAIVMWVRIPTLSASVDTVIYLYYDNGSISTSQENKTGVWDSSYQGVWHLKEDPSGTAPQMQDSTANHVDGTSSTLTSANQVAGKIGGSLQTNGTTTGRVTTGYTGIPTVATFEAWINIAGYNTFNRIFDKVTSGSAVLLWYLEGNATTLTYESDTTGTSGLWRITVSTGWHHVVTVHDRSSTSNVPTFYLDGAVASLASSIQSTGTFLTNTDAYVLMNRGAGDREWNGNLDEFRISSTARSAGWITTEYNNQNSPSTFFTVGVATLLASFTDALTISASRSMTIQPSLIEGLTAVSSFSQSESYQAVDGLTISDVPAMQSWHIDALTIADQAVMGQTGVWTDGLTSSSSLTTTEAATALESLSAISSSLRTQALSSLDALSVSSLFAESQAGSFVEGLTISSASTSVSGYSVTETGLSTVSALALTQALQAIDALAIASTLSEQSGYQTSDQATISSTFSSTPTFAPTDLLNMGSFLLQTETSTWSDVLSISSKATGSGGFAPSDLLSGLSQLQETDAWTMLDALSIADSSTWTQDNLGVPTTTYSFIEQLSISSFFAAVISSLFPEGLSISSQITASTEYATSDALSLLSSFLKADEGVFAEPLMLTETTTTASTYQPLDQLIISAALQNTSSMQDNELLSVLSSLLGTDIIAIVEPLTLTDSSTMTQQSTGATYSFLEQLVISSLFNGVQIAALTETLVAQSTLKVQEAVSFSDLLIMSDTGQIVQTPPFIAPLYARSTLVARDGRVVLLCRDGRVILVSRGNT